MRYSPLLGSAGSWPVRCHRDIIVTHSPFLWWSSERLMKADVTAGSGWIQPENRRESNRGETGTYVQLTCSWVPALRGALCSRFVSDISGLSELKPADSAKVPACVRILVTYQKAAVDWKQPEFNHSPSHSHPNISVQVTSELCVLGYSVLLLSQLPKMSLCGALELFMLIFQVCPFYKHA